MRVDSTLKPRVRERAVRDWRRVGADRLGQGWSQLGPDGKPRKSELAELLVRVSRGDQVAFASFYDATSPAVYGLALGAVGDNPSAEAVTREVYLSAWRLAGTFDPTTSTPLGWLCGIAHTQVRLSSARATAAR